MSFFHKIKLRKGEIEKQLSETSGNVNETAVSLLKGKHNSAQCFQQSKNTFLPCAPASSLTSKTPSLCSDAWYLCYTRGLSCLLPRKIKPGRKDKSAVTFLPCPRAVRTPSRDSPGRCGRPESCTKRLSWPVPRPPLLPLPPPAPLPPPPAPAAPPLRRFLSHPCAADMTR